MFARPWEGRAERPVRILGVRRQHASRTRLDIMRCFPKLLLCSGQKPFGVSMGKISAFVALPVRRWILKATRAAVMFLLAGAVLFGQIPRIDV